METVTDVCNTSISVTISTVG